MIVLRILFLFFLSNLALAKTPPKLIVQIVIDQLRGDLIERYQQHYGDQGFKRLLAHGIHYSNAEHPHANTVTCVGHAVIATGAEPALNGIVANGWYDVDLKKNVYCAEDARYPLLTATGPIVNNDGRSPKYLSASTLSDALVLAQKGRAYAVSLKDRAAITLAGHAGKAFWLNHSNAQVTSSSYYFSRLPSWVNHWNEQHPARAYHWKLSADRSTYQNAHTPRFKNNYPSFGTDFPHYTGIPDKEPSYFKQFAMTPFADARMADFALTLLQHEKLGRSPDSSDYLAISFSTQDVVGHHFGPQSLEAEENLKQLDKTIARLLDGIDHQVGLENTLVILTADHGVSDSQVYLRHHHMPEYQPINDEIITTRVKKLLKNQLHLSDKALSSVNFPYIYLNHDFIKQQQQSITHVQQVLAEALQQADNIFKAYPLLNIDQQSDWLGKKIKRMYYPKRSGDIYLVTPPFLNEGTDNEVRVSHGSPWRYDSHVPIIFYSAGFNASKITRPESTQRIASTLSQLLDIQLPSSSSRQIFPEVIHYYR